MRSKLLYKNMDYLTMDDWKKLLRFYRILRCRVPYAEPGSQGLDGERREGHSYGYERAHAQSMVFNFATNVDWCGYVSAK